MFAITAKSTVILDEHSEREQGIGRRNPTRFQPRIYDANTPNWPQVYLRKTVGP